MAKRDVAKIQINQHTRYVERELHSSQWYVRVRDSELKVLLEELAGTEEESRRLFAERVVSTADLMAHQVAGVSA